MTAQIAAIPSSGPPTVPSVKNRVSAEEWKTRVDLAALYRLVAKYGMTDLTGTHLSARVPGEDDRFLINPYGLMFEEVTAFNLVKVDENGEIALDTGFPVNPAGFTIHSAIHMGRPDVACVAHTHTVAGIALSSLEDGLIPITQTHMAFYGDRIGYHDWEGIATNLDERERLVRDLGNSRGLILRNHGLLVVGQTIPVTWRLLYFLEKCCQAQLEAMAVVNATGQQLRRPSPEVCEHTAKQFDTFFGSERILNEWDTYLAEVDAIDESYRH